MQPPAESYLLQFVPSKQWQNLSIVKLAESWRQMKKIRSPVLNLMLFCNTSRDVKVTWRMSFSTTCIKAFRWRIACVHEVKITDGNISTMISLHNENGVPCRWFACKQRIVLLAICVYRCMEKYSSINTLLWKQANSQIYLLHKFQTFLNSCGNDCSSVADNNYITAALILTEGAVYSRIDRIDDAFVTRTQRLQFILNLWTKCCVSICDTYC